MARLRRGGWRDWSAAAAAFALFLQMMVAVAHDPLAAAAGGWIGVPICHLSRDGTPSPANAPAAPPCPICIGLAACAATILPPPVAGGVLVRAAFDLPPAVAAAPSRPLHRRAATAEARAPPAAA